MAKGGNKIGSWAFLVGVILAVVFGLGLTNGAAPWMISLVFILGIIVGLLNVTAGEVDAFLIAGAVLVIVASLGSESVAAVGGSAGVYITGLLKGILLLFVPATIVVAVKHVFVIAKN